MSTKIHIRSGMKKFEKNCSTVLPDSELELWLELTVEVEHSESDRLLWMASTWVDRSSKRRLR